MLALLLWTLKKPLDRGGAPVLGVRRSAEVRQQQRGQPKRRHRVASLRFLRPFLRGPNNSQYSGGYGL